MWWRKLQWIVSKPRNQKKKKLKGKDMSHGVVFDEAVWMEADIACASQAWNPACVITDWRELMVFLTCGML